MRHEVSFKQNTAGLNSELSRLVAIPKLKLPVFSTIYTAERTKNIFMFFLRLLVQSEM